MGGRCSNVCAARTEADGRDLWNKDLYQVSGVRERVCQEAGASVLSLLMRCDGPWACCYAMLPCRWPARARGAAT